MFGNTTASADMGTAANSLTAVAACDPVTGTVHRPGKPVVKVS